MIRTRTCNQWCCTCAAVAALVCLLLLIQTSNLVSPVETFELRLSPVEDFVIPVNVMWHKKVQFVQRTSPAEDSKNLNFEQNNGHKEKDSSELTVLPPDIFLFDRHPRMVVEVLRRRFEAEFTVPSGSFRARARRLPSGSVLDVHWRGYRKIMQHGEYHEASHRHYLPTPANATVFVVVFRGEDNFRQWERTWQPRLADCKANPNVCALGKRWYCTDTNAAYCSSADPEGRTKLHVPEGGYRGSGNAEQGSTYYFVWGSAGPGAVVMGPNGGSAVDDGLLLSVETEWAQRAYDVSTGWSINSAGTPMDGDSGTVIVKPAIKHTVLPESLHSVVEMSWQGGDRAAEFDFGVKGVTHVVVSNPGDGPLTLLCVLENRVVAYVSFISIVVVMGLIMSIWMIGKPSRSWASLSGDIVSFIHSHVEKKRPPLMPTPTPASPVSTAIKRRNTGPRHDSRTKESRRESPPPRPKEVAKVVEETPARSKARAISDPLKPGTAEESKAKTPARPGRRRRDKRKDKGKSPVRPATPPTGKQWSSSPDVIGTTPTRLFDRAPGRPTIVTPPRPTTAPVQPQPPHHAPSVAMRAIGLGCNGGIFSGGLTDPHALDRTSSSQIGALRESGWSDWGKKDEQDWGSFGEWRQWDEPGEGGPKLHIV